MWRLKVVTNKVLWQRITSRILWRRKLGSSEEKCDRDSNWIPIKLGSEEGAREALKRRSEKIIEA